VLFADSAAAPKESPPIQPERPQRHEKLGSSANELIRDVADDNLQEAFQRILEMRSGPSAAIDSQQELPGQGNSEVKQPEPTRGIKR